jgi:hypothetical protein
MGAPGPPAFPASLALNKNPWAAPRQQWVVDQLVEAHDEALYRDGEYTIFVMLWQAVDEQAGLVARCKRCFGDPKAFRGTSQAQAIAATYKQANLARCPDCYGTSFEGGWKAMLVRPATWKFSEDDTNPKPHGVVNNARADVQSTHDFELADGDWGIRADLSRWRITGSSTSRLSTGFGYPDNDGSTWGYTYTAQKEDAASVAFTVPPTDPAVITQLLATAIAHFPADTSAFDVIRGPVR